MPRTVRSSEGAPRSRTVDGDPDGSHCSTIVLIGHPTRVVLPELLLEGSSSGGGARLCTCSGALHGPQDPLDRSELGCSLRLADPGLRHFDESDGLIGMLSTCGNQSVCRSWTPLGGHGLGVVRHARLGRGHTRLGLDVVVGFLTCTVT